MLENFHEGTLEYANEKAMVIETRNRTQSLHDKAIQKISDDATDAIETLELVRQRDGATGRYGRCRRADCRRG